MLFATEFPVKSSIGRGEFLGEAIAWVRGMDHSTLFSGSSNLSDLSDEATITSPTGEKFTVKECVVQGALMVGVRHELTDDEGRTWRSEVTLKTGAPYGAVRSKTQCIMSAEHARLQVPRKPYFLTLAIDDGWAEADGSIPINRTTHTLRHNRNDIELASRIIAGTAGNYLPVIYISRTDEQKLLLSDEQLSTLSHRLSGVAHVFVEPSREFSLELMGETAGRNPYGGSLGFCVSQFGVVGKYYLGHRFRTPDDLFHAVYIDAIQYVSNKKPRIGIEWQDLIEASASQLRQKANSNQVDIDAWSALRDEENAVKDETITALRGEIERLQQGALAAGAAENDLVAAALLTSFGREIYAGELSDRVRRILVEAAEGHLAKLDGRTIALAQHLVQSIRWSGGAERLEARLKSAARDSGKADDRLGEILLEMGYARRKVGGHPVYLADELAGLPQQTLSTSPSDNRAGRNAAGQIIRDLGLGSLKG